MVNDWLFTRRRQQHRRRDDGVGIRDRGSQHDAVERMSISSYVTNLPKDIKTNELWNRCTMLGTVIDVHIAHKLSKMERRFGIVRFIKVRNSKDLESRLCEIWFGNYHIFVSISQFPKKENYVREKETGRKASGKEVNVGSKVGRSNAKAITGEKSVKPIQAKVIRRVMIGGCELTRLTTVQSPTLEPEVGDEGRFYDNKSNASDSLEDWEGDDEEGDQGVGMNMDNLHGIHSMHVSPQQGKKEDWFVPERVNDLGGQLRSSFSRTPGYSISVRTFV
ncbi:hypothetical protein LXL04_004414 [Taraxacum kok-saghyz]